MSDLTFVSIASTVVLLAVIAIAVFALSRK